MPAPQSTRFSVAINDAARGLAQQMVLWGHDVMHPGGNALVRFGLQRAVSPGLKGTSCYSMPWQGGLIELHGAVASWTPPAGSTGSLFDRDKKRVLGWYGSRPPVPGRESGLYCDPAELWLALHPLLAWLVGYEEWVLHTLGKEWRTGCWKALGRLPAGKVWLPPEPALEWWKSALCSLPPRPRFFLYGTL